MYKSSEDFLVIAHRGASGHCPENTISAIKKSYQIGVKFVEIDVRLTSCNTVIVFHDYTLDRTTNGFGKISEYSYSDIINLDAGSWFSQSYRNERIPRLSDVLILMQDLGMTPIIEIKVENNNWYELSKNVLSCISSYWKKNNFSPIISSFNIESLRYFKEKNNNLPIAIITDDFYPELSQDLKSLQCFSLHINNNICTYNEIKRLKLIVNNIFAYTINNDALIHSLIKVGVNGCFSDYPDIMLTSL